MSSSAYRRVLAPVLLLAAIVSLSVLTLVRAPAELRLVHGVSLLGAVAIYVAWWRCRERVALWRVLPAFVIILLVYYRGQVFHQLSAGGTTYDEYLLFADRGFGFHPSLAMYGLVERLGLFPVISAIYGSLTLCLGLCYALHVGPGRRSAQVFALLALAGVAGPLCYRLLPACGPVWLLGSSCYTGEIASSCANLSMADLGPVPLDPSWPRNAIPSLHLAWALLMWWTLRDRRVLRWVGLAFVLGTALATLGGGEHYLVDLVAAFPFSLGVWALCMGDAPLTDPRRMLPLAGSWMVLLVWVECIRLAPQVFWISPLLTWAMAAGIAGGTLVVLWRCWPVAAELRVGESAAS